MSKIKFTHISQLAANPEPQYLVEGLIPSQDITVVYGEPKSAKTFIVLDIGLHVASGTPYRGREVQGGPVAYCALEGGAAFPNRIEAIRRSRLIPLGSAAFWLSTDRFTFLRAWGAADLIRAIEKSFPEPPKLVVIDTLNRSLSGSENADIDMTEYTKCIEQISVKFACSVIVIHHSGVSKNKPRGHTSLTGTCAAQLKVSKVNKVTPPGHPAMISLLVEFMKDGQEGQQLYSWLKPVSLGLNNKGQEITSCYITEAPAPTGEKRPPSGEPTHTEKALAVLQLAIEESGEGKIRLSDWRDRCRLAKMGRTKDAWKRAFYRALEKLQADGVISIDGQWVSLSEQGKGNGASKEEHADDIA